MKELNLEVGQKVWSIQLGDCEVVETSKEEYSYIVEGENGGRYSFDKFGRYSNKHFFPSLFLSNPFQQKLVQENSDGWIEPKENKAELINALCNVYGDISEDLDEIVETKLQKLLESL